jgi:hypothetical protein
MRSVLPMEGNPWPHDMVISVADDEDQVMELLWVREAWGLHPVGDLPPLLVDPPAEVRETPEAALWENAWPAMWGAVIRHAGIVIDPASIREVAATPAGSPVRADLLAQLRGPTWRDRFGESAFDDRYPSWIGRLFQARKAARPRSFDDEPERRALAALVAAWEAGLTRIVTTPCRGEHTRIISESALLVTDTTRADTDLYSAALASFQQRTNPGG